MRPQLTPLQRLVLPFATSVFCVIYLKGGETMPQEKCRKYQLTINNPIEHGLTHGIIKEILETLKIDYWCMCDEIGLEGNTPHTHIFLYSKNAILFSSIKQRKR